MKAVNLLPTDQRSTTKTVKSASASKAAPTGGAFGAYCVLGGLALAVLGSAALVLTSNQISDKEAALAQVSAQRQATDAKVVALKPYGDFQALATQRVSTVVSLATSRFDWDRSLADISRALPADVRIKTLNGSVAPGAGGQSASALRGSVQSPAIEISGCTTSQAGVARLMSRLRAVRGVTRVALAKSDKDTITATSVQSDNPATAVGEDVGLCGRGAKPTFEMVMFFERAKVLPGAETAPAAPAATPAPGKPGQPAAGGAGAAPAGQSGATQPASAQSGAATTPATTGASK